MIKHGTYLDIGSTLTEEDTSEIAENATLRSDGTEEDVIDLIVAWKLHVEKFDQDRSLPWTDHSVWNEHDLAGALFLRDFTEDALKCLTPSLAAKLRHHVDEIDALFRTFTSDDSGERMAEIASVDMEDRGWWWFRVPDSGPIAQDFANIDLRRSGG